MADGGCRRGHHVHEFLVVDLPAGETLARVPDNRARTRELAVPPAVEHGAAREHDGRDIHGRRRHQARRRGFVATGGEHDTVDGIAVQDFDEAEVRQIAVERGSGALARLLDRMDRKLKGDAAGVTNAVAHTRRQLEMVAVTWRKVRPCLRNPDDRFARLQLLSGNPVVHVALEIQRRHARIGGIVEPAAAAQA
jgi:hypothetical protein